MRIELGSQKLPPDIIPLDYKSQLPCALTIDQSILGRSNALITVFGGFHKKSLLGQTEMGTSERKDRQLVRLLAAVRDASCKNTQKKTFIHQK